MSEEAEPAAVALPLETGGDGPHRYELSALARGPWRPDAAHGGAPAALLAREIEGHCDDGAMRIASIAYTFLGPVMLGEVDLESSVVKRGRRQKVVDASISAGGRTLISARAVLLRVADLELPGGVGVPEQILPDPETCETIIEGLWADGGRITYHGTATEVRRIEGGPEIVSPTGKAWFGLARPVVEGEEPTPAQRAVGAADFGNGLAHPVAFGDFIFVNCDLTVTMQRDPVGKWIGLDSLTEIDSVGSGSTTTALHDVQGRFGTATQTLYVDVDG